MSTSSPNLAPPLVKFVAERIATIEELEVFVRLFRPPSEPRDVAALAAATSMRDTSVLAALERLERNGLVRRDPASGAYAYAPKSPEIAAGCSALVEAYSASPIELVSLIAHNAVERVRTDALRLFSESFLLRRKRP